MSTAQETTPGRRILIIGCGYLGTRIGALLLSRRAEVIATTREKDRRPELATLGFRSEVLEVSRAAESPVWRLPYDAVVYAVAPGRSGDARSAFRDGPVECARLSLESRDGARCRFVLVSSTGVYDEDDGGWVDEESRAEPTEDRLRWLRESEDALRDLAVRDAFEVVVLRLGGLYGPDRSPIQWLQRPQMRATMARGRRDAYMNWVRVEDAAEATVLSLDAGRPGETYDVVDGEPVRRAEFYRFAAERAGLALPDFATTGGRGKRCRGEKARRELGFLPRFPNYREGLTDLLSM